MAWAMWVLELHAAAGPPSRQDKGTHLGGDPTSRVADPGCSPYDVSLEDPAAVIHRLRRLGGLRFGGSSMTKDATVRRVEQILRESGIRARRCEEDESFLVEHWQAGTPESSSAVEITFHSRGQEVLVVLVATVLEDVTVSPVERFGLLESLNQLNSEVDFGKFYLNGSAVYLRYDLPTANLTADELIGPLLILARIADEQDDRLIRQFGGLRAADVIARFQELVAS